MPLFIIQNLRLFILLFPISFSNLAVYGQEYEVKNTIEKFFIGMKTGDTTMINSQLYQHCTLNTITADKTGQTSLKSTDISSFINSIAAKPKNTVYDEQILSYDIQIDGHLAMAWTPYKFYLNSQYSHCGVNVFMLIYADNNWKIFSINDTRRKECE